MTNYKKLSQLITDNKEELYAQLKGLSLPADAEKIKQTCVDYVGALTRKDAEYMNQLSLLEQDLLSPVLRVIETLYSSDIELNRRVSSQFSEEDKPIAPHCKKKFTAKSIAKEFAPAMMGAAGGTLIATLCRPSSWGVILFGSVVSAIVGKVLYGLYIEHNSVMNFKDSDNAVHYPEYKLTEEDVSDIIKGLESAGECIDKVLLTYRRHLDIMQDEYAHKMASFNLDKKYIGVLECFQAILGNMYSIEMTPVVKDTIKKVSNSLTAQGYKAVRYSDELKNLFEIKEGDCTKPEEYKPAIIKKEEDKEILILKGEVVLPQNN